MENEKKGIALSNGDSGFHSASVEYDDISDTASINNDTNNLILEEAFKPDSDGDKYVFYVYDLVLFLKAVIWKWF